MSSINISVRGRVLVTALVLAFAGAVLVAGVGAQAQQPSTSASDTGDYLPQATIIEIMDSMMMSSAQVLWDSTGVISTAEGVIELKPETEEDWQKLRWSAVTLAEATNALVIPGRRVDRPDAIAGDPLEGLGPDEIQALIDDNRAAWVAFAHSMHGAAMETIRAIDAKDLDGLSEAGGTIDAACEGCHLVFWYPE